MATATYGSQGSQGSSGSGGTSDLVGASIEDALWATAKTYYSVKGKWFTDLLENVSTSGVTGDYQATLTGSGVQTLAVSSGNGGRISMTTTAAAGSVKHSPKVLVANQGFISNPQTSVWFVAGRFQRGSAPGANTQMLLRLENLGTNIVSLGIDGNGANLQYRVGAGAAVATSQAIPALNTDVYLAIGSDGTTVTFYYGTDPQSSLLTSIGTVAAAGLAAGTNASVPSLFLNDNGTASTMVDDLIFGAWG